MRAPGRPPLESHSDQIWFPETAYNSWMAVSIVLMTTALLFYHMTQSRSLQMPAGAAAAFAVGLMVLSIMVVVGSIVSYYDRISNVTDHHDTQARKERKYQIFYTSVGAIFVTVEVLVCVFIIKSLLRTMATSRPAA